MFASSTLSSAERNYSQLHREALAVVFAVKKFSKYLYGHKFMIFSDHKPLEQILGNNTKLKMQTDFHVCRYVMGQDGKMMQPLTILINRMICL